MQTTIKDTSVIIPVYNRKDELLACLKSVFAQKGVSFEIIVIDNGSTDGTAEEIRRFYPEVFVVKQSIRSGPSFLRNKGILESRGRYLLFLDSDAQLPDEKTLSRMLAKVEGDALIGSVGGEIYNGESSGKAAGRRISFLGRSSMVIVKEGAGPEECDYLATCNCFVSRKTILKVGGFDPYYFFGSEDKDIGFRIKALGLTNVVGYDYGVYHRRIRKARSSAETFHYHVASRRFAIKNLGILQLIFLFMWDILQIVTFYPLLPIKIAYKFAHGHKIGKESFIAPLLIFKAYFWNMVNLNTTIKSKNANFLSSEEMEIFLKWFNKTA